MCSSVFFFMTTRPPRSTPTDILFPYTALFRSVRILDTDIERDQPVAQRRQIERGEIDRDPVEPVVEVLPTIIPRAGERLGRKGVTEARGDQDVDDRRAATGPRDAPRIGGAARARGRSEERRVGKEGVRTCRSRWSPDP